MSEQRVVEETRAYETVVRPYGWRVVVVPPPKVEGITGGGVIIPTGARTAAEPRLERGVVIAVPNDDGRLIPAWALPKVGEVVHYSQGAPVGDVIVVATEHIWAVEENDG